jgi:hypothetical protein
MRPTRTLLGIASVPGEFHVEKKARYGETTLNGSGLRLCFLSALQRRMEESTLLIFRFIERAEPQLRGSLQLDHAGLSKSAGCSVWDAHRGMERGAPLLPIFPGFR